MYSDGQQALLGSRDAPWLGSSTVGSVGPGETAGVFDSLKKSLYYPIAEFKVLCWFKVESLVITMTVYQSNS